MIIDITPTTRKANTLEGIYMETNNITELYEVTTPNGKAISVQWTNKTLAEFASKYKVSEMLAYWESGYQHAYNEAVKAVETGLHPTWKTVKRELDGLGKWTGKMVESPTKLNEESIEIWEKKVQEYEEKLGKLNFVKIVL